MTLLKDYDMYANDTICLYQANVITDIDFDVLKTLYQPIIGSVAVALYSFIYEQTHTHYQSTMFHKTMRDLMQIDFETLYTARKRLESIGLLKTYRLSRENNANNEIPAYIYAIQAPMSAEKFLTDPIFCGLLIGYIGQNQFDTLKEKYTLPEQSFDDYVDVSTSFDAIFGKSIKLHIDNSQRIIGVQKGAVKDETSTFDWGLFNQLMQNTFITKQMIDAQLKTTIANLNAIYGISALDIRDFVIECANIAANKIDNEKLFRLVRNHYLDQQAYEVKKNTEDLDRIDTNTSTDSSPSKLVRLIKTTTPNQFIIGIKQLKSRESQSELQYSVSRSELLVIENLRTVNGFSSEVINTMIYYTLVVLNHDYFNRQYVEKMASDWISQNITTYEKAQTYLKNRQSKRNDNLKHATNRYRTKGKVVQLSDKEKEELNGVDTPLTPDELENLRALMDRS